MRDPICINLFCSWIRDFVKASRDGILQLWVVNISEWNLDMNTKNFGPILLRIERTNCSSFLSIPHCLHYLTRDLNFEKNCYMVSTFLGNYFKIGYNIDPFNSRTLWLSLFSKNIWNHSRNKINIWLEGHGKRVKCHVGFHGCN